MFNRIIFIFIAVATLISCHKDSDSINEETITNFSPDVVEEGQGDILGYVYNESNQPIPDATVQIYSGTTKTNKYGVFRFKNARVDKNGTYIRVLKDGYIFGSDVVYPSESQVTSYIKMMATEQNKSFESASGGSIQITGGGKIDFPAEAIVKSDGSVYNGKVSVTAKLISPSTPDLAERMPGALVGIASGGNTVVLGTAGMIAVELRGENGSKLNLRTGRKARIEVPASDDMKLPAIPLWHFDESKGLWKEEGSATLENSNYVGEVSHFSFWNVDVPYPLINVCGKVVFANGDPAKQIKVSVMAEGLNTSFGFTDEKGIFCGKMPKGKVLTFKIVHPFCGNVILEKILGPFDSNTELDPFVINVEKTVIFGSVKCNEEANPNATIVIKVNDKTIILKPGENGNFEYNLTSLLCANVSEISVFAFDDATGQSSGIIQLSPNSTGPVLIETCINPCDFSGALEYNCDSNILTANISGGGSGSFTFQWSNGATTPALTLMGDSIGSIYCVTITEISGGCSKNFCKQIGKKLQIGIGNNCQNPNKVVATIQGGIAPYAYDWSNGSENSFIEITAAGEYCLTVTDVNGCTASVCKNLTLQGMFIDPNPSSCDNEKFNLNTSPFAQGRIFAGNTPGTSGVNISVTYPIMQSVFNTGFTFSLTIWDETCEAGKQIQLPQFKGLSEPTLINTTCGTCSDGKINFTVNSGADCIMCTPGDIKIFKINDLNNDLSSQNNNQMLAAGEYYVVVEDANTGCYIAFRKVKIL